MKNLINKIPLNLKLTLTWVLVVLVVALLYYPLIPTLLNYPPDSINNAFQIEVNYFYYTTQYLAIVAFVVIAILIAFPLVFRKINIVDKVDKIYVDKNSSEMMHIIKTCFNFPIVMLISFLIFPPLIIFIGLLLLKQELIFSLKLTFILFSMGVLIGLLVYSFSRAIFERALKKINITDKMYGMRINVRNKTLLQLLPLLVFSMLFTFLILYSQITETQGNYLFDYYKQNLTRAFEDEQVTSVEQAKQVLESIPLKYASDSAFILDADGNICYSEKDLSDFFIKYIFEYENEHDGHTYEYYGNPVQGAFIRQNINGQDYILGIRYSSFNVAIIPVILLLYVIVVIINLFFIFLIAISYRNDLKVLADNLSNISKNSSESISSKLPVYSNDEIGDMTIAFNRIQDMTNDYITQLHANQESLMENERLASLGQLIGGIAHNLKTPIMSISGAAEGLTDLIKEYDSSIDDPEVNSQDHHDIAKDMSEWVSKIKNYTEYMSDIITAVKGQAVTLSNEDDVSFTLEELLKRVNILMKHELKNALIYLNIKMLTDESTVIHGDVNALVQVINNMISNSIQAYNGKTEQNIDLIVEKKDKYIIISVKDYASGLPDGVKEKLFKEMITTKGKNGTGLGLYMSYSTIRAHFNGDIKVESEKGKGTTFSIILPL